MRIENGKRKVEDGGVQDTFHFPLSIFKSNVVLRCVASGGIYGGTLTLARNGAFQRKLSQVGGSLLPGSVQVPPESVLTFEAEYGPVAPSDAANDIVATASLVENFLNETHTNATSFTSVKVELEADKIAPGNSDNHRHVYGIAEDIHYRSYPLSANVTWSFPAAFIDRGAGMVMCPWSLQGLSGPIVAEFGGFRCTFEYSVVEPSVEARNPRVNIDSALVSPVVGEAGHLLLYLDLYAVPLYVSFEGVQMREVPDESQSCPHQGYYDDRIRGGNWSHTASDGAGTWFTVSSTGYVMTDRAGHGTSYQPTWTTGWKEWAIPMEWEEGGVVGIPFNPNPTTQRFELQSDGHFTIRKHGHYAERNVIGLKWCDGGLAW